MPVTMEDLAKTYWGGLFRDMWGAAKLPGDVYAGRVDPTSDEGIERAAGLAGMVGGGPFFGLSPNISMASRSARLYNPPIRPQRPFDVDYPAGVAADEAGRVARSIEGSPLVAQRVVGRRVVGGEDEALPPEELDALTAAITGRRSQAVAPREIGGDAGRMVKTQDRRSGGAEYDVFLSRELKPEQGARVLAHEDAHVIDDLVGKISHAGLSKELHRVYNDLNNPSRGGGKPFTPQALGYKGEKAQRELMAEAVRAYMADPNYIKSVAPETAKAIRKAVNDNPKINREIQFNVGGVPVAPQGDMGVYGEDWL